MSYRQNYHANVPYSGSVHVSYPKSDSGGTTTAHYSGSVPVNVTINVNTSPFDGSVDRCNTSVDLLTGSVVAMRAAQCAAIQQTTKDVSKAIIDGFFGTIKTELSQQMQALDSAIQAGLGLLVEQGKAVSAQKGTMEIDYHRISSRYAKLFSDLDEECHKRIYALDKQSFTLAEKVKQPLLSEQRDAALNMLEIEEESTVRSFLLVSNLNKKAQAVLRTLLEYITQETRLTNTVSSFMSSETIAERTPVYMPVLYAEADSFEDGGAVRKCFMNGQFQAEIQRAVSEKTQSFCNRSEWKTIDADESERVKKEFDSLAESYFAEHDDETNRRVHAAMLALRNQHEILEIK